MHGWDYENDKPEKVMTGDISKGDFSDYVWKQYKRKGLSEMRPYIKGEDLSKISVSDEDSPETDLGMVARNPDNHSDQWYVARQYFEDNLEELPGIMM